jgi:omega-6 fatty acid desaturase (delta-12 desaturase)
MNTLIPYFVIVYLMIRTVTNGQAYWLTLLLALPAAGLLVRIFILFHDCTHGSFFRSKRANTFFGYLLGIFVFTSFEDWRKHHLKHHQTYADLDSRGWGDVWTMTLQEYELASKASRFKYRLYRHPLVLFGIGALFNFLIMQRFSTALSGRREKRSLLLTNLLILGFIVLATQTIGWQTYIAVQLPIIWMAGAAGIWLFYVQHQFEGVYWSRKSELDEVQAGMTGSSYFNLPPILRWFSGNIGYHHIHHLNALIPNYNLKKCYDQIDELQIENPLNLRNSWSCAGLKLWDEKNQELVSFP